MFIFHTCLTNSCGSRAPFIDSKRTVFFSLSLSASKQIKWAFMYFVIFLFFWLFCICQIWYVRAPQQIVQPSGVGTLKLTYTTNQAQPSIQYAATQPKVRMTTLDFHPNPSPQSACHIFWRLSLHRFHTLLHLNNKRQHIRHNTNWRLPANRRRRFRTLQHWHCHTPQIRTQRRPTQMVRQQR